jgi:uncharacterized membrane protein
MPEIGSFHPQIVHFVIALLGVGVVLRLISLTGRLPFTSPAATTLIVLGALASVFAAASGDQAHGPAERIPGAREAVVSHEDWGNRTRNLFLVIAAVDVVSLVLSSRDRSRKVGRGVAIGSAVLGMVGLFFIYETGEHGGELVYEYAGGVGTRSGNPADVQRLLIAGLYHNAIRDREAGRGEDAARLFGEMERRRPNDPEVRLLVIESTLLDRRDAQGALSALRGFAPGNDARLGARAGLLRVDAFLASGQRDSAVATLQQLRQQFPQNARIRVRADSLGR